MTAAAVLCAIQFTACEGGNRSDLIVVLISSKVASWYFPEFEGVMTWFSVSPTLTCIQFTWGFC